MLDVPTSAVNQLAYVLAQVRALQKFIDSNDEDASGAKLSPVYSSHFFEILIVAWVWVEYRLGVASGGGKEYVVVAAVAEALDKVAELKRQVAPDKAKILAQREKLEQVLFPSRVIFSVIIIQFGMSSMSENEQHWSKRFWMAKFYEARCRKPESTGWLRGWRIPLMWIVV
jgi:hypothetical protein